MKKILAMLLFVFAVLVVLAPTYAADEEELIELYPYGDPNALYGPSTIYTLVGDSNWDVEFAGYRYHIVRAGVRMLRFVTDSNANGTIEANEMTALSWNAFASLYLNDTDEDIEIATSNNRTDISTVVHRMYAYFNEEGQLYMFEDHINTYYIHNDGADANENADWRLATQAEIDAFVAAGADAATVTPNTRNVPIRIMLDAADPDGHVAEPLTSLAWTNPDVVGEGVTDANKTLLLDYDPRNVMVPAGHSVLSFGTKDRDADGERAGTVAFIKGMPALIGANTAERANISYLPLAPAFAGLTTLDKDPNNAGVQIVIDHKAAWDLPLTPSVSWVRMFGEEDEIINQTEKLDYTVEILQASQVDEEIVYDSLQTIEFTYDAETDSYSKDAEVNVIDTTEFGAAYIAKFTATAPDGQVTEVMVDIVVGIVPPRFVGVVGRFGNEYVPVDLLGSVTAVSGAGVDMTDDIRISYPESFNPYAPKPGVYNITLQLTQHIHIEGVEDVLPRVFLNGTEITTFNINQKVGAFTDKVTVFWGADFVYNETGYATMVIMEVDEEGNLVQAVDRTGWQLWNEQYPTRAEGPTDVMNSDALVKAWVEAAADNGHYIVIAGSTTLNGVSTLTAARAMAFGSQVLTPFVQGIPDEDHYIDIETSYKLTILDTTAPTALVANPNYTLTLGSFTNVNQAILANVIAFDNYDTTAQLAKFVEANGGMNLTTAGTYDVTVVVEDRAGNSSQVSFQVKVVAASTVAEDVAALQAQIASLQALLAEQTGELGDDVEAIQALIATLQAKVDALEADVDAIPTDTGCAALFNVSNITMSLLGLVTLAGIAFAMFKRKY